ncbi:MAG: cytochrome-c peroxidase [Sorangiineae bacterium NIC37A_2]|jgi:cytochrome c peroxidase|nr:MAG: cytochrome-c peroxidase [Sorangiineae bacterium NIC37A_2]
MRRFCISIFVAGALVACKAPDDSSRQGAVPNLARASVSETQLSLSDLRRPFRPPLPETYDLEPKGSDELVRLGQMLYFDKRLSKNHDLSCNSCHQLDRYGVDGEVTSFGHKKQRGGRNSPTVYNAAGHFVQFWDGRSPHVEHQATQPIVNPVEMAMAGDDQIVETLESIPGYVSAFASAFPGEAKPITVKNAGIAMGAFERKLTTPSRFDRFLAGEDDALTTEEQEGLRTFVSLGCASCHEGTLLGGRMYQKAGITVEWPNQKDQGRFDVTGREADRMLFKVPSLRNIAMTGPYFHDGSVEHLGDAVRLMGEHQLGRKLTDQETGSIVTFLNALTGTLPEAWIQEPKLPASGPKTPRPDPN